MGMYVTLGRGFAVWIEFRREWREQKPALERFNREWLIALPFVQMVYTPP